MVSGDYGYVAGVCEASGRPCGFDSRLSTHFSRGHMIVIFETLKDTPTGTSFIVGMADIVIVNGKIVKNRFGPIHPS